APEIPPVIVTPNYNGDDIGTLNIVEGVNFKISVKAENSYNTDMTRLYANSTPYNIVIDIDNTGTENCTGANFQLDFGDLNFSPSSYDRILGTIVPGAKKSLSFTVNCPTYIDQLAYKDKVIGINIKDVNNRSWDDSVQLQFHKAPVQFNIRSDKQVQGVIISPRQKAYHFSSDAASGYSTDVTLPWTTEPYLVVFSGATLESETRYSFGINVIPDTNFIDFYQTGLHEPNNTEEQAYVIDARTEPKVMSFLHLNDIDYFLVNLDPDATPVYIAIDNTDGVYTVSGDNNGDGGANPGENFTLNLKVRNIGVKDTSGVSARLSKASNSGNSSHLSINYPDNVYLGALSAGGASVNAAFSMNISSACPAGVDIPLQVEFTNNDGDKWQSNFSLHIYPPSPANVQAQALSETKNLVSWNKATGATGYKIYNSIGEVIETVNDGNTLSYEHSGLSAGTVYRYRVSTLAAGDESVKTAEVSARTWERLIFNKQHGGMVSAGIPHYYRFYVTNSTSYRFSSNVSTYVKYESNNDNWFNLLSWDEPTMTASQSGWAYINFENAGDYSLRIMSGESTVGNFVFTNPTSTGTVISEADKTVTVRVPFGTNLTSLTPSVTAASGWTCATSGAKNFTNPVEYVFTKGDATQIYCVTVIPNGDGEIEINPPPITDIDIPGFPTTSFSLSRSEAGGIITSKDITLTGTGYTSIQWWVGEKDKTLSATNGRMTFTVNASEYTLGQHTLTVIVFKEGVPYSSEVDFNVVQ
ncbi:MAG: fibronectin type III domain-containing protein, partial [Treponema sp.]|nr:fibronectin type III domain-containing protein [Treponema sp.]